MSRAIVDTNVLIVANGDSAADAECAAKCARQLADLLNNDIVLLDTARRAIDEYRTYCDFGGSPPKAGNVFFQELFRNIANPSRVAIIDIGCTDEEARAVVPESLANFDPSDLKWLALYTYGSGDAIYNATDSDYLEKKSLLEAENIKVVELCPNCIRNRA